MTRHTCDVDGCDRPHVAKGWCSPHYARARRNNGDPGPAEIGSQRRPEPRILNAVTGEDHPRWTGDAATYSATHKRLMAQRGPAVEHRCRLCSEWARDWCYSYSDVDEERTEVVAGRLLRYSVDLEAYDALCRSCHQLHDVMFERAELGRELTEQEAQELRPPEYGT